MAAELTAEQAQYLREHRLAVLATGRRDGSPQLSTVMSHFDGTDIVASMRENSAKWRNAGRQPRVALLVADGRRQLVCYGTAQPEPGGAGRLEAARRLRTQSSRPSDEPEPDDEALDRALDERGSVALRITPERVTLND